MTRLPMTAAISDEANPVENSECQAALAEQELNETRIADLEDKLARAEIVSKLSGDTIKFGATVTLIDEDTGEKRIWQIVGEPEADASDGKISVTSPIGRALIGKTKGTTVLVEAPAGAKAYTVREVGGPESERSESWCESRDSDPMEGCFGSQQLLERRRRTDKAPTVESMGGKCKDGPRCDIFLTFAMINSFPVRKG
jgi:transcription elongation factor GreA